MSSARTQAAAARACTTTGRDGRRPVSRHRGGRDHKAPAGDDFGESRAGRATDRATVSKSVQPSSEIRIRRGGGERCLRVEEQHSRPLLSLAVRAGCAFGDRRGACHGGDAEVSRTPGRPLGGMGSMVADRPRRQPEPSIAERAAHYEAIGGQPKRAAPTAIPPLEGRAAASKAGRKAPGSARVDVEVPLHRGRQAFGTNVTSIPYANSPVAASCFARCPKGSDFSAK
jgi:hypothetical protein